MCEMNDVLEFPDKWECVTCGHEWPRAAAPEIADGPRIVKDAHGNVLADGDCVILIKDLKLGGSSVLGLKPDQPEHPANRHLHHCGIHQRVL